MHSNQILSLQNADILIGTEIANLINTTQLNINAFNRLNVSNIADGSINNKEFQTLSGIDTTQTIQHQINGVKSQITALAGLEDIDLSSIVNLQSNIVSIQTTLDTLNNMDNSQATFNNNIQNQVSQNSSSIANNNTDIINLQNVNTTQHTLNLDFQDQITSNMSNVSTSILTLQDTINSTLLLDMSNVSSSIAQLQDSINTDETNITAINTLLTNSAFTSDVNFYVIQGAITTNTTEIQDNRADINDLLLTSTNIQNGVSDLTARVNVHDNSISSINISASALQATVNTNQLSNTQSFSDINSRITINDN